MNRNNYESAIKEIHRLMKGATQRERDYQSWFEQHHLAFSLFGLSPVIPHPRLPVVTEDDLREQIPDFIGQEVSGLWRIVEIKTPVTKVLKPGDYRPSFYAEFQKYVSQCRDYSHYFREREHRNAFERQYGIQVQDDPPVTLIAGSNAGIRRDVIHKLISDYKTNIDFLTFDDIVERVERSRVAHFGQLENLSGMSLHCMLRFRKTGKPYRDSIVTFGERREGGRIELLFRDPGELVLSVAEGEDTIATVVADVQPHLGRWMYLTLEAASGPDLVFISLDINDETRPYSVQHHRSFTVPDFTGGLIGGDGSNRTSVDFDLAEFAAYSQTLTFQEREEGLREYFSDQYAGGVSRYVEFGSRQFMVLTENGALSAPPGHEPRYRITDPEK